MEKVLFIVHENGRATLQVGNTIIQEIDECSGLDKAILAFNDLMASRHLSYRLASGFAEMFKKIMEEK